MSEVISFRLNRDNHREAQALETLSTWCAEGYSVRNTLTEALLKLGDYHPEHMVSTLDDLKTTLVQVSKLLEQLTKNNQSPMNMVSEQSGDSGLTDNFIASVKKSAKRGMKFN